MFVLISVFRLYMFNDNDKVIHCHKILNLLNNWKFEFLSQLNLYILKKLLNFANEKKAKVKKDTNKIDKFEYFKKNFIVFESTYQSALKFIDL